MNLKDVLSPALATDPRLRATAPTLRRVFTNDPYEIYVCLYPGFLTYLVYYKKEALRVMSPLWDDATAHPPEVRLQAAVERLQREGRNPMHLIRDAKLESGLQLTLHDRASLRLAGVEIPRAAGRYRDLFGDSF